MVEHLVSMCETWERSSEGKEGKEKKKEGGGKEGEGKGEEREEGGREGGRKQSWFFLEEERLERVRK